MYKVSDFPAVGRMQAVSLEEMASVSLMNRTDTKFVTTASVLKDILEDAADSGYRVCEISGVRLLDYESVYFDTSDLKMFTAHRNGKKTRQKVRVRTYLIDNQTFLEVKRKRNNGRTKKKRIALPEGVSTDFADVREASDFLESRSCYRASELSPETTTDFSRFTLVDPRMSERLTIDMNIHFRNLRSGVRADLGDIVIIELKQSGKAASRMREILTCRRVFPYRISKYCIAVSLTDPQARPGRFKEKIRYINRLREYKPLK